MACNVGFALCVFGLVAHCVSTPVTRSDEHNIFQCIDPGVEKELLYNEPVVIKGDFLQIKDKTIVFPTTGINSKKITCISIQDRDANGHGAFTAIKSGGLGDYSIEIEFVSQLSEGINFNVEIYADAKAAAEDPGSGP